MRRAALLLALLLLALPASGDSGRWGEGTSVNQVFARATADQPESTGTPVAVPGLSFDLLAGMSYGLECYIDSSSADASGATGVRLGLTGPASTRVTIRHASPSSDTAVANKHFGAFGSVHAAASTVPGAVGDAINTIHAIIQGAGAGTLQVVVTTETAGAGTAATVKAGSYCELHVLPGV